MNTCLFVSDLHGKMSRYEALFKIIRKEKPDFVFIGGDLLPHRHIPKEDARDGTENFIKDFLIRKFTSLSDKMECAYPEVFIIPGNDDHKILFDTLAEGEKTDLWRNLNNHCIVIGKYRFYGYACVPPTPFKNKDWERFDVMEEVSSGCIAPADGFHSLPPNHDPGKDTIQNDILKLVGDDDLEFGVFLFHSPPFQTALDQAEINVTNSDRQTSCIPVGSKAIGRFIDEKKPYITMHGHIHESARLIGEWKQSFGRTWSFSAAHHGPELAVIKFELQDPLSVSRRLIKT